MIAHCTSVKMPRAAAMLSLLCMAVLATAATAQLALPLGADTTNMTYMGYKLVSNVTGHLYISKDACEISRLMLEAPRPLNFARARFMYTNGSNAPRGTADNRNRTFLGWTTGSHATDNAYFNNGTALYGNNSNWMGQYITDATDAGKDDAWSRARGVMVAYSVAVQVPLGYMMSELLAVADEINPNGTTDTAAGAPHALEEAFGVYVGVEPGCAPWSVAETAAPHFGTQATCGMSKINQAIVAAFSTAQAATQSGNVASYVAARDTIFSNVKAALIQGVIHAAQEVEEGHFRAARAATTAKAAAKAAKKVAKNLGKPGKAGEEALRLKEAAEDAKAAADERQEGVYAAQAAQYTLFRALGPFIHMADPAAARALNTHFAANGKVARGHTEASVKALAALYPKLGVTAAQIGTLGAKSSVSCP